MNLKEAEATLRQIKYKPNHTLRWAKLNPRDINVEISDETAILEIYWEFERPDCYNPSEWGVGRSGPVVVYLPHVYTKEQLVRTVFGMTMRLEEHEAREWFLYGIMRPFDPHKELLDRSFT